MNDRYAVQRLGAFFSASLLLLLSLLPIPAAAEATAAELERDSRATLRTLLEGNPAAQALSKQAKGILVFPKIIKAGLVLGGAYGEGALLKGAAVGGFYNSATASWGLQAGVQAYGYAVFLMTDQALKYLDQSSGWELGTGPSLVVVDEGAARNFSTSTLRDDAYAFIFDQRGLMLSVSIEGSKISRIER